MSHVLLVCALHDEYPDDYLTHPMLTLCRTGVGKLNAALAVWQALQRGRPQLVVNYGTAGATRAGVSGLLEVGRVLQRDMCVEPFAPRGTVPFHDAPAVLESGHGGVTCGSGDSFVTSSDPWLHENGVDVVDMELFAVAEVCRRQGLPWRAFKYVTDSADDSAALDWQTRVQAGAALFHAALTPIVGSGVVAAGEA